MILCCISTKRLHCELWACCWILGRVELLVLLKLEDVEVQLLCIQANNIMCQGGASYQNY